MNRGTKPIDRNLDFGAVDSDADKEIADRRFGRATMPTAYFNAKR